MLSIFYIGSSGDGGFMDHWLGVVTCNLINTALSLSPPVSCCFCRPGLFFGATAFSLFSFMQLTYKWILIADSWWGTFELIFLGLCYVPNMSLFHLGNQLLVSPILGYFTLLSVLGWNTVDWSRAFISTLTSWGAIYTLGDFSKMPGDWWRVEKEKKCLLFYYSI